MEVDHARRGGGGGYFPFFFARMMLSLPVRVAFSSARQRFFVIKVTSELSRRVAFAPALDERPLCGLGLAGKDLDSLLIEEEKRFLP